MSNAKVNFDLPTGIENLDATVQYTTPPYPVEVVEATTVTADLAGFLLFGALIEATTPASTISGVELRPILQTYTTEPEATEPTTDLTGIELDTVLIRVVVDPEATVPTPTLSALTLTPKLVSYENAVDATTPTSTIGGIELT